MQLIKNVDQLLKNVETIELYIAEGNEQENKFAIDLVRLGKCFLAYKIENETRFAPSRFLGYTNNNLIKHSAARNNHNVDGRETNPIITQLLGSLLVDESLDQQYLQYCFNLGIEPSSKQRKYWQIKLDEDFSDNKNLSGEFKEGKIVERRHLARERSSRVVQLAKENFKRLHGKLFCEACDFDFEERYGKTGKDFIEGHHKLPVNRMIENHTTKPEDIALLCSNCHRMIHREWMTVDELKQKIKANERL